MRTLCQKSVLTNKIIDYEDYQYEGPCGKGTWQCQDDNNSVAYRKKDGVMFSNRRCHPRDLEAKPYSEKEVQNHETFTSKSKIAAAWTKANRKYSDEGKRKIDLDASTEDYRKMRAAFDAQKKIMSFQAFVWKQVKDGA